MNHSLRAIKRGLFHLKPSNRINQSPSIPSARIYFTPVMPTLRDRCALVTGAGRGLGRSHALLLASLGAKVMVNDTGAATTRGDLDKTEPVAKEVAELIRQGGGKAEWTQSSAVDGVRLVKETMEAFGRLDILVLNAGILRLVRKRYFSDSKLTSVSPPCSTRFNR
jgi:NAD(P)-dependent dehydrogenase (short-subunit alcohol dehydrogenase family)